VTAINKISSGASRLIRYQRSGTRQRKLRRARSRTPAFPLIRAVTMKAGTADPRTFSSAPCGVAPPGSRPGSVSARSTNISAVVVAYTSTKNVAIGCLMIHNRSGETSVPAACSVCSAMIGTSPQQGHHGAALCVRPRLASRTLRSPEPGRRHAAWRRCRISRMECRSSLIDLHGPLAVGMELQEARTGADHAFTGVLPNFVDQVLRAIFVVEIDNKVALAVVS